MQSLILGTAQWGLDYGVTNVVGRLPDDAVLATLAAGTALGVTMLDTAPAYGDAEERIRELAPGWRVQTKVSGSNNTIREDLHRSQELLGRSPERLIVHDWPSLSPIQRGSFAEQLETAREEGLVLAVGISGYDDGDVATAMSVFSQLDVVQVPVSLLDQRLVGSDAVAAVREKGGLLQARSVYLQGLALSTPALGGRSTHPDLVRMRVQCAKLGLSPAQACRAFVRSQGWVDEVVVGVTTPDELAEWGDTDTVPESVGWEYFASVDVDLLDPRRWTRTKREG